jgi:hypothetical protein
MLSSIKFELSDYEKKQLETLSIGYSSADLSSVVKDAAMAPLRNLPQGKTIMNV